MHDAGIMLDASQNTVFVRDGYRWRQERGQLGMLYILLEYCQQFLRASFADHVALLQEIQKQQHVSWAGKIIASGLDCGEVEKEALHSRLACAKPIDKRIEGIEADSLEYHIA